jgi:exodeoxyribonuclease VIII
MKITMKEYHSLPDISKSDMKHLRKSLVHHVVNRTTETEQSKAMLEGSAFHAIIEGDFNQKYFVLPKVDARTKEGKALIAELKAQKEGKQEITQECFEMISEMKNSLDNHPLAQMILDECQVEESFFFEKEGIKYKSRPDFYSPETGIAVDLKSCQSAAMDDFRHSVFAYDYHIQSAICLDSLAANNLPAKDFYFLCVEKSAPYAVAVYALSSDILEQARIEYEQIAKVSLPIFQGISYQEILSRQAYPQAIQTIR